MTRDNVLFAALCAVLTALFLTVVLAVSSLVFFFEK